MADNARVFVSHHHSPEEDAFTARLVKDLEAGGADVWVDDQRITSDDFIKKINEGLVGRQWLVLVMTPDALRSQWVEAEVNAALNQVRKGRMLGVIPIVAQPCDDDDVPPLLDPLQRYDATRAYEPARNRLLQALGLRVPAEPPASGAPEPTGYSPAPPQPLPASDVPSSQASAVSSSPTPSSAPSANPLTPAQPADREPDRKPRPAQRIPRRSTAPTAASHAPSDAAVVASSGEQARTPGKRVGAQIARFRPTGRQVLLLVLAIAVIGGGIAALASWSALASALSASLNPAATSTELAFQRAYFATETVHASQLTRDYKPTGIGLCDTVDPPYGSTTEHSYWESQGVVRCPGAGVTELEHGGRVEFFGFPLGFPLAYHVSATFAFPSSTARSCVEFDVGSVGGKTVDISLCNNGTWLANGGAAGGTVSMAGSYVVTISVTQTTGAVSVNGATVIPSAPLSGETYSIQIDASGIASGDALAISDFALHPMPA